MKKVGLLIIALVVALGGLGVGYAMWSDTINVVGSVETGDVCIQWLTYDDSDMCIGTEGDRPVGTVVPGADPKFPVGNDRYWDKNVACTEIAYYEDELGNIDYNTLIITVYNAYPGYYADWELEWVNCGTIPVRIQRAYLTPLNFTIASNTDWTNPQADGEIWIDWVISDDTLQGVQLEPGEDGASSFKLLIMQTAEQNATYQFTLTIDAVQWDEYTPNPEVPPGSTPL